MHPGASSLTGFRGTRGELLVALKRAQPLSAAEVAAQFGVTPNALRRHLKELAGEGLVSYQRVVRGVGGPVFAYSLTEAGESLFPRAYDTALTAALEMLREQQGTEGVVDVFRKKWEAIATDAKPLLDSLPLDERTQILAELLSSMGYMAEVESKPGQETRLREHNCVMRAVAERFPEVCAAEAQFLEQVLGAAVTREAHIASGANCCEYCIAPHGVVDAAAASSAESPSPETIRIERSHTAATRNGGPLEETK